MCQIQPMILRFTLVFVHWTLAAGQAERCSCKAGYFLRQKGDLCDPCPSGTFSESHNGESYCQPCSICEAGRRIVSECNASSDTLCGCPDDHYKYYDGCTLNAEQSLKNIHESTTFALVPPETTNINTIGSVQRTSTDRNDQSERCGCRAGYFLHQMGDLCEPCPINTFSESHNGRSYCQPCSICEGGRKIVSACNASRDTLCRCPDNYYESYDDCTLKAERNLKNIHESTTPTVPLPNDPLNRIIRTIRYKLCKDETQHITLDDGGIWQAGVISDTLPDGYDKTCSLVFNFSRTALVSVSLSNVVMWRRAQPGDYGWVITTLNDQKILKWRNTGVVWKNVTSVECSYLHISAESSGDLTATVYRNLSLTAKAITFELRDVPMTSWCDVSIAIRACSTGRSIAKPLHLTVSGFVVWIFLYKPL